MLLGIRENESSSRNLTLKENNIKEPYYRKQRGFSDRKLFLPILDFSIEDVWATNLLIDNPVSLKAKEIADLYARASEDPNCRNHFGAPSGKARFGCWTCTVAKNGITLRNLVNSGRYDLIPLQEFRKWLEETRNEPKYRWEKRRNGKPGPGPMTAEWRQIAFKKLLNAQLKSGYILIGEDEINEIINLWSIE